MHGIRQMAYGAVLRTSFSLGSDANAANLWGKHMRQANQENTLSARESQIASLYIDGLSYKEVARELEISPGTVRTHLNAIYRKLEISSRTELARCLRPPTSEAVLKPDIQAPIKETRGPERRQLTFLFADIVGSTEIASRLDAEDMHELLTRFRNVIRQELARYGGHIAGFPGDGAMAVFGWPEAAEEATQCAASAALAIASAVGNVRHSDGQPLSVRVGVATGMAVVGSAEGRTADFVGSAINLASRLQGAAPLNGVLISELTHALTGNAFKADPLPPLSIRGIRDPVNAYHLVAHRDGLTRFEAKGTSAQLSSLVGRDVELSELQVLWKSAADGQGCGAILIGQAGIGKSRLAESLALSSLQSGARLFRLQCSKGSGASPFWPIRRAIKSAAGLNEDASKAEQYKSLEQWLSQHSTLDGLAGLLVADMMDLAPDRALPEMNSSRRRQLLLKALVSFFLSMSQKSPLFILLEDAHWIDPSTLEFVELLLSDIHSTSLMLLITTRPEGEDLLRRFAKVGHFQLTPLNVVDAERLVRERAQNASLSDETIAAIVARTDGLPLFLEEVTAAMVEGASAPDTVPATLRESLTARLDRLGSARETAQVAGAIGRDVDFDLLALTVQESRPNEVADDVQKLIDAGLATPRAGGFVFSHALVRDAAYQTMLRVRRQELHAKIAELMLGRFRRRFAQEPETLALHLERGGRTAAAIDYYLRAAEAASTRAANNEAEGYAVRALELAARMEGGAKRDRKEVAALLALGRIRMILFGYGRQEAAEPLRRALDLCQIAGLRRTEFPLVVSLTAQASVSGNVTTALDFAQRAMTLANDSKDQTEFVMASYASGLARCWRGERHEAAKAFDAGLNAYDESMHDQLVSLGPQDSGVVCMVRGAFNRFHCSANASECAHIDRAVELAEKLGHSNTLNYALHWKASQALDAQDWVRAEHAISETLDLAEDQDFTTWRSMGRLSAARLAAAQQNPDEALKEAKQALDLLPKSGNIVGLGYVKGLVGDCLRRLGRKADALALLREAVQEAETTAVRWGLVETLRALARCRLDVDGGDTTGAETELTRAIALARRQGSRLFQLRAATDLAELFLEQGDLIAAREAIEDPAASMHPSAPKNDVRKVQEILSAIY